MTEFRAAIWAAVSSKPQYRNDSTTSQIEDARAVIRQRGWSESRLYEVPGHTRAYITLMELLADPDPELDAYRQFIADCRESAARVAKSLPPTFNVVICRARDRLGRTDAVIADMEAYARYAGAAVFSSAFPTDPEIASEGRDTWVSAIERAGAQEDNRRRRDLMTAGKVTHARKGKMPVGDAAFGYRRVHKLRAEDFGNVADPLDGLLPTDLVVYEPEAAVVRLIYTWYLENTPIRRIATQLNEMAAPAPGARWYASLVRLLLHNPIYCGQVVYGRYQWSHNGGQRIQQRRPTPLVCAQNGRHRAIVSETMFAQVQDLMAVKAAMCGRAAGSPRLFSGLLRCACGYALGAASGGRYRCIAAYHEASGECDNRTPIYEPVLREWILASFMERAHDAAQYARWRDGTDQTDTAAVERSLIETGLAENAAAVQKWNGLYERGKIDEDEWSAHRARLRSERERLDAALNALSNVEHRRTILPSYDEFCTALTSPDDATLRAMMLRVLRRITWDGTTLTRIWR
jgi:hypothetical protein